MKYRAKQLLQILSEKGHKKREASNHSLRNEVLVPLGGFGHSVI